MFKELKKQLYFNRMQILLYKGMQEGLIIPFTEDKEFMHNLSTTYLYGIPISIEILYLKPNVAPGKCDDRSLAMFFANPSSLLVRGDNYDLELRFGKENAFHGWIEIGDYVYDPTLLHRFDKELYYKIYRPTDVKKYSVDDYCSIPCNKELYDEVTTTTIDDFKPQGKKRTLLLTSLTLVKGIADISNNDEFKQAINSWLETIEYDEQEIQDEMNKELEIMMLQNKKGF